VSLARASHAVRKAGHVEPGFDLLDQRGQCSAIDVDIACVLFKDGIELEVAIHHAVVVLFNVVQLLVICDRLYAYTDLECRSDFALVIGCAGSFQSDHRVVVVGSTETGHLHLLICALFEVEGRCG